MGAFFIILVGLVGTMTAMACAAMYLGYFDLQDHWSTQGSVSWLLDFFLLFMEFRAARVIGGALQLLLCSFQSVSVTPQRLLIFKCLEARGLLSPYLGLLLMVLLHLVASFTVPGQDSWGRSCCTT